MSEVAQVVLFGRLTPAEACEHIRMADPVTMVVSATDPGWKFWNFSFQILADRIFVVVNFSHDSSVDRGLAVLKVRNSTRNLVNWLLLSQAIMSSCTITLQTEEVIAHYEGEPTWTIHDQPPSNRSEPPPRASSEAIRTGVGWLGYLLRDSQLLYALQDYASAIAHRDFALFFLYRALEWIMWAYDERTSFAKGPDFAQAAQALGLSVEWLTKIGSLAHTYTRHAGIRVAPDPFLVEAAFARMSHLIHRYIDVRHRGNSSGVPPVTDDPLTSWTPPNL